MNDAIIALATEKTRDAHLICGITYIQEKIKINIMRDKHARISPELHINTTLVAHNISPKESQTTIVKTINTFFGEDNIIGVSFEHDTCHVCEKQSGWYHIQCLSATVYTE